MKVYRSNLQNALYIAIKRQDEDEKERGYSTDSAFLAGLKEIYTALSKGENLEIIFD